MLRRFLAWSLGLAAGLLPCFALDGQVAPAGGADPFRFPQPLVGQIERLRQEAARDQVAEKKYVLLTKALNHFEKDLHLKASMAAYTLPSAKDYVLTQSTQPAYFAARFAGKTAHFANANETHYSYVDDPKSKIVDFWVDFANLHLGGGVFGHGFVQEEIMCCEMPEMANAAAEKLLTRSGQPMVLGGGPEPWLFKGVHRVMEIRGIYGNEALKQATLDEVKKVSSLIPPQQILILAIAAPETEKGRQASLSTIEDLFNTFVAGFELAKQHTDAGKFTRINTGPIGAGVFGNSKDVVYVVQLLAAQQVGVDLRFWSYDDQTIKRSTAACQKILGEFDAQKARDPRVKRLLEIASNVLKQTPGGAGRRD